MVVVVLFCCLMVQDRGEALAERLRALKPSSATLIVVPPPMLPHWRHQLTQHAEAGAWVVSVGVGGR